MFSAVVFSVLLSVGSVLRADKLENSNSNASTAPMKIKFGYIGLTCEAPLFVAVEKGFFKEENLDVSLAKCDWANYKDTLGLGGFDITHHLIMLFLKPIE